MTKASIILDAVCAVLFVALEAAIIVMTITGVLSLSLGLAFGVLNLVLLAFFAGYKVTVLVHAIYGR